MMDRALNGVTTITLKMGGAFEIAHGLDGQLVAGQLTSPLLGENRFSAGRKGDIR
jgi:hypothetical protein